jgi:hypothetical protein
LLRGARARAVFLEKRFHIKWLTTLIALHYSTLLGKAGQSDRGIYVLFGMGMRRVDAAAFGAP